MSESGSGKREVCLLGAGSYGTAVARIVADNLSRNPAAFDPTLSFWARRSSVAKEMEDTRVNSQYLPGAKLPSNICPYSEMAAVVQGCDVVILGIPSNHLSKDMMDTIAEHAGRDGGLVQLVSLAKGIEYTNGELRLVSDMLREGIQHPNKAFEVSVLMGANVADQMGRDEFAEATLGCGASSTSEAATLLSVFDDPNRFSVTLTMDRTGVELSGALKNVVSLAAGYAEGLNLGSNTKAAVIRNGLKEMIKFAKMRSDTVKDETFLESSGIADLMTTCFGGRGRLLAAEFVRCNGQKGWAALEEEMLNGQRIPDWHNAQHVFHFLNAEKKLENFPLFVAVYRIGFEGSDPASIVDALKRK
ncbi:hypothetical protein ACHAXT_011463 [Thalassiosira profunda]